MGSHNDPVPLVCRIGLCYMIGYNIRYRLYFGRDWNQVHVPFGFTSRTLTNLYAYQVGFDS